jgi:hypothetical protein
MNDSGIRPDLTNFFPKNAGRAFADGAGLIARTVALTPPGVTEAPVAQASDLVQRRIEPPAAAAPEFLAPASSLQPCPSPCGILAKIQHGDDRGRFAVEATKNLKGNPRRRMGRNSPCD